MYLKSSELKPATVVKLSRESAILGRRCHGLSLNESPFPPLPGVLSAAEKAIRLLNRYPDPTCGALIAQLTARLGLPEECIAVGAGSLSVAANLVAAMSETRNAEVMYAWGSGCAGYETVCRIAGAHGVRVPMTDGARQDLDLMVRKATPDTRIIILGSPHNPTGTVIGHHELESFLRRVPAETLVLLDEAYHEFVRDPAAADGPALCRKYPNLAVLRTFSAAHGLAGLRVGYLIADPAIVERVLRRTPPYAVTSVAEQAAVASLRAEHELAGRVDWIVEERERVAGQLRARGFALSRSEASFLWIPLPDVGLDLAAAFRRSGIDVRLTTDGGIRITIGSAVANDAVVAAATMFTESRAAAVAGTRRARGSLVSQAI